MKIMQSLFVRILLALTLALTAGTALAGPSYHVAVDTSKYAGYGAGGFQMTFLAAGMPDAFNARVSNLGGAFLGEPSLENVGLDNGVLSFSSANFNEFYQIVTLGGVFSFDLAFDGPMGGDGGTAFNVGLYDVSDDLFEDLDVLELSAVFINFSTGEPVSVTTTESGSVTEVPEPSTLPSMLSGIGLLGLALRKNQDCGSAAARRIASKR